MDHASNVVLDPLDFTPDTLLHAKIFGDGDQKIGTVVHVHGLGVDSKVVFDVGGFLGLGTKLVMMAVKDMTFMRDDNGKVHGLTTWTKEQIQALPEHGHEYDSGNKP
jgi:hypothetical protein